jgi:hypothetical protein
LDGEVDPPLLDPASPPAEALVEVVAGAHVVDVVDDSDVDVVEDVDVDVVEDVEDEDVEDGLEVVVADEDAWHGTEVDDPPGTDVDVVDEVEDVEDVDDVVEDVDDVVDEVDELVDDEVDDVVVGVVPATTVHVKELLPEAAKSTSTSQAFSGPDGGLVLPDTAHATPISHFPSLAPFVVSSRYHVEAVLAPGPTGRWFAPDPHRPSNWNIDCGRGAVRGYAVPFEVLEELVPGHGVPLAAVKNAPPGESVGRPPWKVRF